MWPGAEVSDVMISGAMPRLAWPGCLPLRCYWCGFGTVTGHPVHPPARHRTVILHCGAGSALKARPAQAGPPPQSGTDNVVHTLRGPVQRTAVIFETAPDRPM
jgi:hypothetical protein